MLKKALQSLLLVTMMVFAFSSTINAKTKVHDSIVYHTTIMTQQEQVEGTKTLAKTKASEDMPHTGDHAEFIIFYSIFLVALSILIRIKKRKAYQ